MTVSTVSNSHATGDAYALGNVENNADDYTGGVVGYLATNSHLLNVYAIGNVSGKDDHTGGVVGYVDATSQVNYSFAIGNVSSITNGLYVGGCVGNNAGTVTECYYYNSPENTDNCVDTNSGTVNSCTEITNANYFIGDVYSLNEPMSSWNFFDVWEENATRTPVLTWQNMGGDVDLVAPMINFTSPTPENGSTVTVDSIYVNISASDTSDFSVIPNFDNSLVSWWRMDDRNSTHVLDYMTLHNGSINGGATYTSTGARGDAFSFTTSDDYISVDDADNLDLLELTISAWVKPPSKGTMKIVSKSGLNTTNLVQGLDTDDVTIQGIDGGDQAGVSVGSGDFNNDGIEDVIIGADGAEGWAGETYIIYGPLNSSGEYSLANANITFNGITASDSSGKSVGSGDFNNDGIDDVIIGAFGAEGAGSTTNNEGETYIIYGPTNQSGEYSLANANVTFYGITASDMSGGSVGSGDFNNDGIDDAIIGALYAEGLGSTTDNEGETYIIYGPTNQSGEFSLANANVTFYGITAKDSSGGSVGSGDFNNDGIDDVIIGAYLAEGAGATTNAEGETYIIYGPTNQSGEFSLANANVTFYGITVADFSGYTVDSGDFNNDGIDDVIIGAFYAEGAGGTTDSEGETYIIYGPTNQSGEFSLADANVTFYGIEEGDNSGSGASSGDFNNDGIDDVIIGVQAGGGGPGWPGEINIIYGPLQKFENYNFMIKDTKPVITFVPVYIKCKFCCIC